MKNIFCNGYGRLRSGWRFLFFITLFLFLLQIVALAASFFLSVLSIEKENQSLILRVTGSTIGLFLAILLGWGAGKLFEGLPFRALGAAFTKHWSKDLLLGLLIGFGSVTFAVLVAMIFAGLRLQFNQKYGVSAILTTLVTSTIIFIVGAAFEEVLFRGYILQTFARARLAWFAIMLTSFFFAGVHLGNPNASYFSTINTWLAGIWLGIAYLKTRTLWLVFGLHFSWNWTMGTVFGIEVSGLTHISKATLLQKVDQGPKWITGTDYGLEGGMACTLTLFVSIALIWFLPSLKSTKEMLEMTSSEKPIKPLI